ncbi:4'-phosphopantetheinyl transferase superfamily protein [Streptomyces alboniger]|uniref:4'-phosphopantetheinyl transferase superfamily protein n=1 Tax=Streptomyces alboniger TaxID=132473 RepID=A0A5J6HNG4_STRAD|nr:4'-phosphopantetheinyl transferase superfamily protein [Streptomyces alboniger]QEV21766.1 4'-phosphopantetheinyl transferase superfamily protein [Streptomyces alboniger]
MDITEYLRCSVPAAVHSAGVDLVDLRRWDLAVTRTGGAVLRRAFSASERAAARCAADGELTPARILGHAFGIKESVVKALGGLPPGSAYADIDVGTGPPEQDGGGRQVHLRGELARWAARHGVTLTGGTRELADDMAVAWVVAAPTITPAGPR